jgi:hypothetical protein
LKCLDVLGQRFYSADGVVVFQEWPHLMIGRVDATPPTHPAGWIWTAWDSEARNEVTCGLDKAFETQEAATESLCRWWVAVGRPKWAASAPRPLAEAEWMHEHRNWPPRAWNRWKLCRSAACGMGLLYAAGVAMAPSWAGIAGIVAMTTIVLTLWGDER